MKYSYYRSDIEVLEKTERSKWKVQCALFISENAILSSLLSYCFGLCRAIIICITLQYERGGKWSTKPSVQTNQDSLSERRGDQCGEQRPITSLVLPPIWKIDCIHIHPIRKKTEVLSSLHFPIFSLFHLNIMESFLDVLWKGNDPNHRIMPQPNRCFMPLTRL